MWIVALTDGVTAVADYGPFDDDSQADRFAAFLKAQAAFGDARKFEACGDVSGGLLSPLGPLLDWYERTTGGA